MLDQINIAVALARVIGGSTPDESRCDGNCSPRFEAILNQGHFVDLWLYDEGADKTPAWLVSVGELKEHAWLEDDGHSKKNVIVSAMFDDFESAMQGVLRVSLAARDLDREAFDAV